MSGTDKTKAMNIVLTALAVTLAPPAVAQQVPPPSPSPSAPVAAAAPGTVATARALVGLLKMERTLDYLFIGLGPVFAQATINEIRKNPSARPMVEELIARGEGGSARLEKILAEEFLLAIRKQYPAIIAESATQYAALFTEDELRALVAFYKSGAGAKSLDVLPQLQQNMTKFSEAAGMRAGAEAGGKAFDRATREMLPPKPAVRS